MSRNLDRGRMYDSFVPGGPFNISPPRQTYNLKVCWGKIIYKIVTQKRYVDAPILRYMSLAKQVAYPLCV